MAQSIIGISLGTRTMGVAIMRNRHLLDWQIKTFKGVMNQQKLYMISGAILKLIKDYDAKEITIKMPHKADTHKNITTLNRHLTNILTAHNIAMHYYTLEDIKAALGVGNKQELLTWATNGKYKELRFVYAKEQTSKNSYHIKLFEAVAALHTHIHRK